MVNYFKFNANPKNKKTTDCVIRAISCATRKDYYVVLDELLKVSKKTGFYLTDKKCWEKYLEELGFTKMRQPKKRDNKNYNIGEMDILIGSETALVSCTQHLTIVKDGTLYDTWDCRNKKVFNYWVKR